MCVIQRQSLWYYMYYTGNKDDKSTSRTLFYYSTYAKCKVTQSFPILITFKPLIMSNRVKDIVK